MSSGGANVIDIAEAAKAEAPAIPVRLRPGVTEEEEQKLSLDADLTSVPPDYEKISKEDLRTLTRVAGPVPWQAYSIAFIEFCERFSYYGTTVVCMTPLFYSPIGFALKSVKSQITSSRRAQREHGLVLIMEVMLNLAVLERGNKQHMQSQPV